MLLDLGHEVFLYGAEGSDAPCTEFIETHTLSNIRFQWGDGDNRFSIGYDYRTGGFRHDFNAPRTSLTVKYYKQASEAINKRKRPSDFLLLTQGRYQKPIADAVGLYLTLEPGIGYRGSYCSFRAFESSYLQNFTYGSADPWKSVNGAVYDRVIPNYFEEKHFPFEPNKEDYFLFIGRIIPRKGVRWAIQTVGHVGGKLFLAGQTDPELPLKSLPFWCKYVGFAGPELRAELMGKAKAVFVPTQYLEAFGGVNVEAQLCGTPVITTNFGVFPETVIHGRTGFLCNTLDDMVKAARSVGDLDPAEIRAHAERYLMKNVQWEFQKWFDDVYQNYLSVSSLHEKPERGWSYVEGV